MIEIAEMKENFTSTYVALERVEKSLAQFKTVFDTIVKQHYFKVLDLEVKPIFKCIGNFALLIICFKLLMTLTKIFKVMQKTYLLQVAKTQKRKKDSVS